MSPAKEEQMLRSRIITCVVVVMVVVAAFAALYYNQGVTNWVAEQLGFQSRVVKIKIGRVDAKICGYRSGGGVLTAVRNSSANFIARSWFNLDAEYGVWVSFLVSLEGYEEMRAEHGNHPCYKF